MRHGQMFSRLSRKMWKNSHFPNAIAKSRCGPKFTLSHMQGAFISHMNAYTPVLTHRKSCSITCSTGSELHLAKLNWHRMTNKMFQTFIRSIGRSYCMATDHVLHSHTQRFDWQPEHSTPGCLWSGNKPAVSSTLAAFTVMEGESERDEERAMDKSGKRRCRWTCV